MSEKIPSFYYLATHVERIAFQGLMLIQLAYLMLTDNFGAGQ